MQRCPSSHDEPHNEQQYTAKYQEHPPLSKEGVYQWRRWPYHGRRRHRSATVRTVWYVVRERLLSHTRTDHIASFGR